MAQNPRWQEVVTEYGLFRYPSFPFRGAAPKPGATQSNEESD